MTFPRRHFMFSGSLAEALYGAPPATGVVIWLNVRGQKRRQLLDASHSFPITGQSK